MKVMARNFGWWAFVYVLIIVALLIFFLRDIFTFKPNNKEHFANERGTVPTTFTPKYLLPKESSSNVVVPRVSIPFSDDKFTYRYVVQFYINNRTIRETKDVFTKNFKTLADFTSSNFQTSPVVKIDDSSSFLSKNIGGIRFICERGNKESGLMESMFFSVPMAHDRFTSDALDYSKDFYANWLTKYMREPTIVPVSGSDTAIGGSNIGSSNYMGSSNVDVLSMPAPNQLSMAYAI